MASCMLPPSHFAWHDDGHRLTLCVGKTPIAKIEESGSGWVVRTLVQGAGADTEPPSRIAVSTLEQGIEWASHWAQCREQSILHAIEAPTADASPRMLRRTR